MINLSNISKLIYENKISEAKEKLSLGILDILKEDPIDPVSNVTQGGEDNSIQNQRTFTNISNVDDGSNMTHGGNASKRGNPLNVGMGVNIEDSSLTNKLKSDIDSLEPVKGRGGSTSARVNRNRFALEALLPSTIDVSKIAAETLNLDKSIHEYDRHAIIAKENDDNVTYENAITNLNNLLKLKKDYLMSIAPKDTYKNKKVSYSSALSDAVNSYRADNIQTGRLKTANKTAKTQRIK